MKLFSLLCFLTVTAPAWADYCNICRDHTMCRFKDVGPACGRDSHSEVSSTEVQQIVDLHNAYRSKIAKGEEKRGAPGPQPPAADMNAFVWDDTLAEVAQMWADQCTFQHDKCRDDPRFKVGQNIYWSSGMSKVDWKRAISAWYEEVTNFNGKSAKSFRLSEDTGHYTQLVWGKTKYIGCGRTTYGGAYRMRGYAPMEYILSAVPSNASTSGNSSFDRVRDRRQSNPGFFGGMEFDPAGAQGALGQNSGESSGGSSGSGRPDVGGSVGRPGASSGRPGGDFGRPGASAGRPGSDFGRPGASSGRPGGDFGRPGGNFGQPGGDFGRPGGSFGQSGGDFGRPGGSFGQPGGNFGRPGGSYGGFGSNRYPPFGSSSFPGGYYPGGSFYPPYFQAYAPAATGLGFFDGSNDWDGIRPVQNPAQYKLPSYLDLQQGTNSIPSGVNELANEHPQSISSHHWLSNEWMPVNYDFTGRDQILICNYGPAGNYVNQPLYTIGQACSRCPSGTTCSNGLCVSE